MVSILRSVCIMLFYSLFWTTSAINNGEGGREGRRKGGEREGEREREEREGEREERGEVYIITAIIFTESCTDVFTLRPPTDLDCNPQNIEIQLFCGVKIADSTNKALKWFRGCKNKSDITDDYDNYDVSNSTNNSDDSSLLNTSITFNVTNDTTGFYWCAVFYTNNDSEITRTDATRVYQFKNKCPCNNDTIYHMHNETPQCFNMDKPDMCPSVSTIHVHITHTS